MENEVAALQGSNTALLCIYGCGLVEQLAKGGVFHCGSFKNNTRLRKVQHLLPGKANNYIFYVILNIYSLPYFLSLKAANNVTRSFKV